MQDRSCGVAQNDNSDTCPGSVSQSMIQEALPELSSKSANNNVKRTQDLVPDSREETSAGFAPD